MTPVHRDDDAVRGQTKDWSVTVSRFDEDTLQFNLKSETVWSTSWLDNDSAEMIAEAIVMLLGGSTYFPKEDNDGIDPVYEAAR